MTLNDELFSAEHMSKAYTSRGGYHVQALNDVSIQIQRGKTLAVVGESGSGKTTLGKIVLQLEAPDSGTIRFHGDVLHAHSHKTHTGKIQAVFQDPYGSLNPRFTVQQALLEPLRVLKIKHEEAVERVHNALELVQLPVDSLQRRAHQFSGGQRQRISIARAIVSQPELIVLDEPTSALDVIVQADIVDLLLQLQETTHVSYLYISHDLATVKHLADSIAVMHEGRIVEQGSSEQIIEHPQHEYTAALINAIPQIVVR